MTALDYFPVTSSLLSENALIEQVLSQYDLSKPLSCRLHTHGINDSYLVTAGNAKYVLRVYTSGEHTESEIEAEISVLHRMNEHGITTACAVPSRDAGYIRQIQSPEGIRYAVLFTFVEGQTIHQPTPDQTYLAGKALAQFHQLFDAHPLTLDRSKHDTQSLVELPLARIGSFEFFASSPEQIVYLQDVGAELKAKMAHLPVLSPAYGICHGDYHSGNLLFCDGDLAIIDFDFCAYSWRLYDVATYIWLQALDQPDLDKIADDVTKPLLDGYQSVRQLDETEQRLIPYFVIVRQFWLLGGSGIPRTTRFGVGWLLDDYFDKFVAYIHRWFERI